MIRRSILAILFGLVSWAPTVHAATNETQTELGRIYRDLMSNLKQNSPGAARALRDSERKWIEYRDAECGFRDHLGSEGSRGIAVCVAHQEEIRLQALRKILIAVTQDQIPELDASNPIREKATAAAQSTGAGPGTRSIVYLKVIDGTAYVLLDIDRDGWAGVSATIARIHPVVEDALLQFREIKRVEWSEAPGRHQIYYQ